MPRPKKQSEPVAAAPKEVVATATETSKVEAKPKAPKQVSYKVASPFRCKLTKKDYAEGDEFRSSDDERLSDLEDKGLIVAE